MIHQSNFIRTQVNVDGTTHIWKWSSSDSRGLPTGVVMTTVITPEAQEQAKRIAKDKRKKLIENDIIEDDISFSSSRNREEMEKYRGQF